MAAIFAQVPQLLAADADLVRRGAFLRARFQVGIGAIPFDVEIVKGGIASFERGPFLMRPWRFAVRASADAWSRFWKPLPEPGWHDLFALTKRGQAVVEGDLQPLLANLQYVKDLLALPRRLGSEQSS
ncbi:MAG: hypothetical protein IT537_26125 [Hyphomicrobiales bacterium]|nr:hypothetical protein [Hyphomicrobiales bacterium]